MADEFDIVNNTADQIEGTRLYNACVLKHGIGAGIGGGIATAWLGPGFVVGLGVGGFLGLAYGALKACPKYLQDKVKKGDGLSKNEVNLLQRQIQLKHPEVSDKGALLTIAALKTHAMKDISKSSKA